MILSLACDTILIISQEALFCCPHRLHLFHSPQHSWGIRLFIQHSYSATYKEDGDELVVVGDQIKYDKNGNYVSGTAEYVADGQYKYGFKSGITNKVSDVDVSQFYKK